jgi:hypothetical protein
VTAVERLIKVVVTLQQNCESSTLINRMNREQ